MTAALPAEFQHLEPYLGWALETEAERSARRSSSSFEDLRTFYSAVFPILAAALNHLKAYKLEDLPGPSRTLLLLMLSYTEAALAVENHGQVAVPNAFDISKFEPQVLGGSL